MKDRWPPKKGDTLKDKDGDVWEAEAVHRFTADVKRERDGFRTTASLEFLREIGCTIQEESR